ncbi:MAG: 5-(carboxyamino)imidazole ribonucleotide synthase [Flavobacteriaceae bacterium]
MESAHFFSSSKRLGILGGGQLGKMLLSKCRQWDIHTSVMDPSPSAPARLLADHFVKGDLMDYQTVYDFGLEVDVLTIEIENVNVEALQALSQKGIKVYPRPDALSTIQDKIKQKEFYTLHNIPTAAYRTWANKPDWKDLDVPCIWKSSRFGYDGYGVKKINSAIDWEAIPEVPCLIENLVEIDREISVIVARTPKGVMQCYEVVEMEFNPHANQVEYVFFPSTLSKNQQQECQTLAMKVTQALNHVGLLAVELFLDRKGEILVNEVAPRPHNSGHLSIEGAITSQFEQHLRAILDLPLGKTTFLSPTIMINLVGDEGHSGPVVYENLEELLSIPNVQPHLYGKKETRPMRKMGHITMTGNDLEVLRQQATSLKQKIRVKT